MGEGKLRIRTPVSIFSGILLDFLHPRFLQKHGWIANPPVRMCFSFLCLSFAISSFGGLGGAPL